MPLQKEGMQNSKVEKQVKDLLSTSSDISEIKGIRIVSRDYKIEYSFGAPVFRTLEVECIFKAKQGHIMLWRGTVKYPYNGSSYSEIANWHKSFLSMPISPTCLKNLK